MMLHTDTRTRLERLVPFGWAIVGAVFLYLLWILIQRDLAWPPIGKAPEKLLPWLMGTEPKIVAFYSSPTVVRGDAAVLCYGVLNIRSVRLDPAVEQIGPSMNRCISIKPEQTTTYTLYAEGNDGNRLTASFTVQVLPPPPTFLFVQVSSKEIVRGDRWALCYGVKNAIQVTLEPSMGMKLLPMEKHCVMSFPPVSMEFKLTATGEDGRTESIKVPLKVNDRKNRK